MKVTVNEQTQRFYLAFEKWEPAVGHEIKVGKYQFCAIPSGSHINISDVSSGVKVFDIPMNLEVMMQTGTKEGTIQFLGKVGNGLVRLIKSTPDFDKQLVKMKKVAVDRLGEKPFVEDIDTDWIFEPESDVVN
ncbi:hypothetical protein [Indiicoccus explosivorum]|uniref:hypothetical protein n=1 Tax=Indiicoccus explosivorum TaxID=1917864 RepID=UPI000B439032|nr:hypothetical protein [Indiicoccus explosivorum]